MYGREAIGSTTLNLPNSTSVPWPEVPASVVALLGHFGFGVVHGPLEVRFFRGIFGNLGERAHHRLYLLS